jgi:hypothetical protein
VCEVLLFCKAAEVGNKLIYEYGPMGRSELNGPESKVETQASALPCAY